MKKIFFIALAPFLFFGCAQNSDDPLNLFNDDPAIVAENGTAEDPLGILQDDEEMTIEKKEFLFEKNQECYKYKKDMQIKNEIDPATEKNDSGGMITSIFYSPKLNTCLYLYVSSPDNDYVFQSLGDVFTGETIEEFLGDYVNDDHELLLGDYEVFQEKVKEYQ